MKLSALLAFGVFVLLCQGCDDDKSEQQGGVGSDDGGTRDAGDRADSGGGAVKDAGDEGAGSGGTGGAGSGAAGERAGAGGEAAGSGAGAGAAGKAGAPSAGAGGRGGAGRGSAGGGGAGAAGSAAGSGGAAGAPVAGAGAGGGGGAAGEAAGAGGESGTGAEAGSGGVAGGDEAGSGGEAGGGAAGEPSEERCETRGGTECGADQFCNFEPDEDCGGTDRGGVCEGKPEICDDLYLPVCGCDNRTHANVCYTHRDGASVKHAGLCTRDECTAAGGHAVLSDGASEPTCEQGEQSWSVESGGDEPAVCCLGEQPSTRTCGGIATLDCDAREFCNYEADAGGQGCDGSVADAAGVCQSLPSACTREYEPVCGCDKKSYSNACEAHSYGVSILHDGACTELDCVAVAGRVVYAPGPAAMCAPGEEEWTYVVNSSGSMAIEGAICCRQP